MSKSYTKDIFDKLTQEFEDQWPEQRARIIGEARDEGFDQKSIDMFLELCRHMTLKGIQMYVQGAKDAIKNDVEIVRGCAKRISNERRVYEVLHILADTLEEDLN